MKEGKYHEVRFTAFRTTCARMCQSFKYASATIIAWDHTLRVNVLLEHDLVGQIFTCSSDKRLQNGQRERERERERNTYADDHRSCGLSHTFMLVHPSSASVPFARRIFQLDKGAKDRGYTPSPFLRGGPALVCTNGALTFTRAHESRSFSIHNRWKWMPEEQWSLGRLRVVAPLPLLLHLLLLPLCMYTVVRLLSSPSMVNVGYHLGDDCCRVASLFAFVFLPVRALRPRSRVSCPCSVGRRLPRSPESVASSFIPPGRSLILVFFRWKLIFVPLIGKRGILDILAVDWGIVDFGQLDMNLPDVYTRPYILVRATLMHFSLLGVDRNSHYFSDSNENARGSIEENKSQFGTWKHGRPRDIYDRRKTSWNNSKLCLNRFSV